MTCRDVEARLTAYLEGDLDGVSSSALRGHLRGCPACAALADDHARLAGALARLRDDAPAPPPTLWPGVLAGLARAEAEDARRSQPALAWRRLRGWARPLAAPAAALAGAAALATAWVATRPAAGPDIDLDPVAAITQPTAPINPVARAPSASAAAPREDIARRLAATGRREEERFAAAAAELEALARQERAGWPAARRRAFDAELSRLRAAVERPGPPAAPPPGVLDGNPDDDAEFAAAERATGDAATRRRAWRRLVAFLQRAAEGELLAEARR